ncbi:MAG: BamA/TamA family outer membrane protein, partial [Polyangiales bacterium]
PAAPIARGEPEPPPPARLHDATLPPGESARTPTPEHASPAARPRGAPAHPAPATRNETALLPAVAGNNVFGVLFGVTGSFTRFAPTYAPFRFRGQLTAVTSLRGTDSGVRSPLQNIDLRLDFPELFGEKTRFYTMLRYQRIENVGYWGLGNGAGDAIPTDYRGPHDRYFTWKKQLAQADAFLRYELRAPLDLVVGLGARGVFPSLWPGTKLDRDVRDTRSPEYDLLYGTTRQLIGAGLVGLLWDARDDEFNPSRGGYHELSFRVGAGPSADRDLRYAAAYLHLRWFYPLLGERLVIGLRGLADVGFGAMPLIELSTMGGYTTLSGPASIEANRALPYGRQLGQVKILTTAELRSLFYRFALGSHRFGLGAAAFVDASRVTARLGGPRSLEGGPVLRYSVGGGVRFTWGSALVLRFDVGAAPRSDVGGTTHIGANFALGHAF